ncbi:RNA polymerase sigma factor [Sulfuriroseicoccus oceanibius]|uniref:RNA polymerase sigma factor n=1 Tax=Sulfuriroseicoccus oceanibius TaxID=2707525 RepID=A0A7T7JBE4_9BACT|nr:sigma-70 family RNA polymerase sigma factor [Sulfuriroseicoccus oceanibius]QQL44168.1 sigma-70 family RNA polymerase sigma factor [Sulfuriroseicoccus oceanibius]
MAPKQDAIPSHRSGELTDDELAARENAIDLALMQRIANGDHGAFAELMARHQRAVIGTIAKMQGDSALAEDLAQQVFLRVWKSAPRYQPTAKFTTWLYTIVRNLVFNESRRAWRRNEFSVVDDDGSTPDFHDTRQASPQDDALLHELEGKVDAALESLPEKQRLAVILRWREHLAYEEIADILEASVSSVKSLLFRARTHLRNHLDGYLADEPEGN